MADLTTTRGTLERWIDAIASRPWVALPLVLVLALPPLLGALGVNDSTRTMENITVLSAQETWLRMHGSVRSGLDADPQAWLMPTRSGVPRVVKPPLVVWLDLLAYTGLRPDVATPQQIIFRSRLVSVAMGLLLVGATWWAGWTLRGPRLALLAAAACATMWFVQRQARIGSYDIHMTAWAALAIAAALWAMRPTSDVVPKLGRQIGGFLLAGAAMGGALMSKGPLGLVVTLLPLTLMAAVLDRRRLPAWGLGLLGMVAVAVALAAPWYVYADQTVPTARSIWFAESRAQRGEFQTPVYYFALIALVAPWSVWLLGGLFQPFVEPGRQDRRRLLWPWLWFIAIFVFFSIPGAKQQRYILPIVSAAALLVGQMWTLSQELADSAVRDKGINLLRVPHWVGLGAASVGLPVVLLFWPQVLGTLPAPLAVLGGVLMLGFAIVGGWLHFQWRPMAAFAASFGWAMVMTSLLWTAYATSPARAHPIRAEAERVEELVGAEPLGQLTLPQSEPTNEEFLIYTQRIPIRVTPDALANWSGRWLIAEDEPAFAQVMTDAGWQPVEQFMQDRERPNVLWKRAP